MPVKPKSLEFAENEITAGKGHAGGVEAFTARLVFTNGTEAAQAEDGSDGNAGNDCDDSPPFGCKPPCKALGPTRRSAASRSGGTCCGGSRRAILFESGTERNWGTRSNSNKKTAFDGWN